MAGKKQKKQEEAPAGAPLWIVTFSDLMSLLLTFFVLLLSFSSIQEVEFQKALGSLKGALGGLPRNDAIYSPVKTKFPKAIVDQKKKFDDTAQEIKEALKALEEELQKQKELGNKNIDNVDGSEKENDLLAQLQALNIANLMDMIDVSAGKNGVVIRIDSPLLYSLGEASLRRIAYPILDKIIESVASWPNDIRIEGHTDDLPINTPEFPSNWELSAARALSVLRYFEASRKIDPTRLSALGYGEHHPLFPNTTKENRAKNRRVEIYVQPPQNRPMVNYSSNERN